MDSPFACHAVNISGLRYNGHAPPGQHNIVVPAKLLEKQKKGKKRMRQIGNVEVPQSAFLAVLKMD